MIHRKRSIGCLILALCLLPGLALAAQLPYGIYLKDEARSYQMPDQPGLRYALLAGKCLSAQINQPRYDEAPEGLPEQGSLLIEAQFEATWALGEDIPKGTKLTVYSALVGERGGQPFEVGKPYLLFGRLLPGSEASAYFWLGLPDPVSHSSLLKRDDGVWRYHVPLDQAPVWLELEGAAQTDPLLAAREGYWARYLPMIELSAHSAVLQPLAGDAPPQGLRLTKGAWPDDQPDSVTVSAAFASLNGLNLGDTLSGPLFPLVYGSVVSTEFGGAGKMNLGLSQLLVSSAGNWQENGPRQNLRIVGIYEPGPDAPAWAHDPGLFFVR